MRLYTHIRHIVVITMWMTGSGLVNGSENSKSTLDGWIHTGKLPYVYSSQNQSWYYLSVSLNNLWAYDFSASQWIKIQEGQGIFEYPFDKGYEAGIMDARDNPSTYGLMSTQVYETSVSASYSESYVSGYTAGLSSLTSTPETSGFAPTDLKEKELVIVNQDGLITRIITYSNQRGYLYSTARNTSVWWIYKNRESPSIIHP